MKQKKESGLPYGISNARTKGSYDAKVPKLTREDGYERKTFGVTEYGSNALTEAKNWVTLTGLKYWGYRRWLLIKEGKLTRFWNRNHSVVVQKAYTQKMLSDGCVIRYPCYRVRWYEDGIGVLREFFPNKCGGTLEQAHIAAELFAVKQRAIHTGGELHLPLSIENQLSGYSDYG